MTEVIVSVAELRKTYKVYAQPWHRLAEAVTRRRHHEEYHALDEVSFQVARGQGLAIVGQNGAGKSTLLKILAGVTAASAGTAAVRGTVASILELGSGFHPEFSGRQNIRLNAAMLGLSEERVEAKLPEIVAFSELGEFIDQPVKFYSSGMAMRLGFAIATQVEPEVLIIDEALSVGDGYFQKKCIDRLQQFVSGGGTLLFCSHAMYYVSAFCQRALWLRHGRMEALGPVDDVVRRYENFLLQKAAKKTREPSAKGDLRRGPARIVGTRLNGQHDEPEPMVCRHGEPWSLEIEWQSEDRERPFHLGVGIDRVDGVQVATFSTERQGLEPFSGRRQYRVSLQVAELPLAKGEFSIYVFLLDEAGLHPYDIKLVERAFLMENDVYEFGLFKVPHHWHTDAPAPVETVVHDGRMG